MRKPPELKLVTGVTAVSSLRLTRRSDNRSFERAVFVLFSIIAIAAIATGYVPHILIGGCFVVCTIAVVYCVYGAVLYCKDRVFHKETI